jgi:hypothetical protein
LQIIHESVRPSGWNVSLCAQGLSSCGTLDASRTVQGPVSVFLNDTTTAGRRFHISGNRKSVQKSHQ